MHREYQALVRNDIWHTLVFIRMLQRDKAGKGCTEYLSSMLATSLLLAYVGRCCLHCLPCVPLKTVSSDTLRVFLKKIARNFSIILIQQQIHASL